MIIKFNNKKRLKNTINLLVECKMSKSLYYFLCENEPKLRFLKCFEINQNIVVKLYKVIFDLDTFQSDRTYPIHSDYIYNT